MLSFVCTPIGNLEDMTPRAVRILREADVIACEDTRRTRALLTHFEIARPTELVSYRDPHELRTATYLMGKLEAGLRVAICTDGGAPGISDPGYRIARLAAQAGHPMQAIPGASAVTAALMVSGLPAASFTCKGFAPRKPGALHRFFADEADVAHTLVFFESPYRVGKSLAAAFEALGNREAAVCLELTKVHERVVRGGLSALALQFKDKKVKGEVTIVIAGNHPAFADAAAITGGEAYAPPELDMGARRVAED
ncbi:MAG: 16S rRNA (cytidine(1402)-2'-O)-methyltransferase [Kiritimatiellia bacterium]